MALEGGEMLLEKVATRAAAKVGTRAALGLLGPLGAAIGVAMLAYDAYELYKMYNESHSETSDEEPGECTGDCAKGKEKEGDADAEPAEYPANPDDLLADGWVETTHPEAQGRGHRTFENPKTGEKIRFDEGKPGEPGWEGKDHYHRYNPNKTGKVDEYLDRNGNPVRRGSGPSHIPAGPWNGS